ncbi:MAG TPA: U32 family peptidase C-terminal domain-containing protein [Desulfotignum sp.]|nr:U32 family peptidase C-terminal domain-containing protein [Desulfotignum sp.]
MPDIDTIAEGPATAPEKPELLAPAGNLEKMEIAIHYGADAVYLAGKDFSLRNYSGNFTDTELEQAVALARSHNVKVYLACNIYSRNAEQDRITTFLEKIGKINPDAVIISDPGIIFQSQKTIPHVDIHLSTQANTTNYNSARFWHTLGVRRVNLARELSLKEIAGIAGRVDIETEVFVHGAMCISYSGRCLLSTFLTNRDSNRGLCSHPCRWQYAVVEELRPNEFYPVTEDERGTYIFNAKDLCMIGHIPELIGAGITSLKIEGRMKGIHYLAAVVKTYRDAIDAYMDDPAGYRVHSRWYQELARVFHRDYSTGFFFDTSDAGVPNYKNTHQGDIHSFIGKILTPLEDGCHLVEIRNKISRTDRVQILSPGICAGESAILGLWDTDGVCLGHAQPNTRAVLQLENTFLTHDIVRRI